MVINNLDGFRSGISPAKTHPKLPIDSYTVLTFTVPRQCFQHIAGWNSQVLQVIGDLKLPDLPRSHTLDIHKSPHPLATCQLFGVLTLE